MADEQQVRLQLFVDKSVADRLDHLAKNVGGSRNQVAGGVLEWSTQGEGWMVNKFGSWMAGKVLMQVKGRKGKEVGT